MRDLLPASSPSRSPRAELRRLVAGAEATLVPGCSDALGARLVETAGFPAAYMTGFGTSAALLGRPDIGLLGLAEMVDNARRVVGATDLPVIADADTGYGNALNVIRTVQEYERAGVAGLHIEDQVAPKRCGHMAGKEVIDSDEFVAKIAAAVAARSDPDLVVIARTDARAPLGLDAALSRAERAAQAGADLLFVEALETEDEVAEAARRLEGTPLVFNWVEGGASPPMDLDVLGELGYSIVILPITLLLAATDAMTACLARIRADGTLPVAQPPDAFARFNEVIGLGEVTELADRFS